MTLHGGKNQGGDRGDRKYWRWLLRGIFTGGDVTDDRRGSDFANAVVDRFREGYALEDSAVGRWFATLEAAENIRDSPPGEFEARFLLSRDQHPVPADVWGRPVRRAIRVSRDYNEPQQPRAESLIFFFSFSDLLPVRQNLRLFRECAISRLKNFQKHPLRRELEMEESAAGAAGAD